jgi:hypothetical protein
LRVAGDSGGSTHDGGAVEKQASLDTNLYLYQVRPFSHPGFTTALANESGCQTAPKLDQKAYAALVCDAEQVRVDFGGAATPTPK